MAASNQETHFIGVSCCILTFFSPHHWAPTPFSPPSSLRQGYDRQAGPANGPFNGLHPKSNFLALTDGEPPPAQKTATSRNLGKADWRATLKANEFDRQNQKRPSRHRYFVAFFFSAHCSLGTFHFFLPPFSRTPLFPALRSSPRLRPAGRSGHRLFQRPSPQKKFPSIRLGSDSAIRHRRRRP